jgi:hypothetical protein
MDCQEGEILRDNNLGFKEEEEERSNHTNTGNKK